MTYDIVNIVNVYFRRLLFRRYVLCCRNDCYLALEADDKASCSRSALLEISVWQRFSGLYRLYIYGAKMHR